MHPAELQAYLYQHIPLSKAMQIEVVSIHADRVVLGAPLAPNINHRHTVFGGSASAVGILAAWSLLHTRLVAQDIQTRLVIQRHSMAFHVPIHGAFTAAATLPDPAQWTQFIRTLSRRGRSRITAMSTLEFEAMVAGTFQGEFVALDD